VTAWVPLRDERAIRFHELAGFKRDMSTAKTVVVGGVKLEEVRLSRALNRSGPAQHHAADRVAGAKGADHTHLAGCNVRMVPVKRND